MSIYVPHPDSYDDSKNYAYTFVSTPGHGYLLVPYKHLQELRCTDQITSFSRMTHKLDRPGYAILEEDCDAPLFITIAEQHDWTINVDSVYADYDEFDIEHFHVYESIIDHREE